MMYVTLQGKDKSHLKLVLVMLSVMDVMEQERKMIGQSHIHLMLIMYVDLLTFVPIAVGLEYVSIQSSSISCYDCRLYILMVSYHSLLFPVVIVM